MRRRGALEVRSLICNQVYLPRPCLTMCHEYSDCERLGCPVVLFGRDISSALLPRHFPTPGVLIAPVSPFSPSSAAVICSPCCIYLPGHYYQRAGPFNLIWSCMVPVRNKAVRSLPLR
jgi:hypothetical protein